MTLPILHHYPSSPYGEVIRKAFAIKGLAWHSVIQPVIMPRPFLTPLTGGYRRIPVLQIGADIYCDTARILRELDRRWANAPLVRTDDDAVLWMARGYSERVWFQTSVAVIFAEVGDAMPEAFKQDRAQLTGRTFDIAGMKAVAPMMQDQWRAIAMAAEHQLAGGGAFLAGKAPGLADLAVWLNVWLLRNGAPGVFHTLCADMPALLGWVGRMDALGEGAPTPLSPEDAFTRALAAEPDKPGVHLGQEPHGFAPGMAVVVSADDYGRDPISGLIHAIDATSIALWRDTPDAGRIVTHFPRTGFWIRPA